MPLLRSPEVMNRARAMGDYLRFKSVFPPRLSEFAILITARHWTQNYEWDAHYQLALKGGLREEIARAVAEGRRPEQMAEDEEILYNFCTELHQNKSVSDATYARMLKAFGEQGVIDAIGISGYYTLLAMVLNTARTPVPAGRAAGARAVPAMIHTPGLRRPGLRDIIRQDRRLPRRIMRSQRLLPALLLLFVGSGCAALIYEVVWFQLLELVIGSSAVSIGVLLGTFMGGMCLGSLLLPRLTRPDAHPLRVYAWLELGIGIVGLIVLFAMPLVGGAYTAWAGTGVVGILLRGVAAGICLLPPTMMMGATLPAMARWVEATPQRRRVARVLLRRQHGGRGGRLPARRLLPAARARRRDRDLRRRRAERHGRGDRAR